MNAAACSIALKALHDLGISTERTEYLLRQFGIDDPENPFSPIATGVMFVSILDRLDRLEKLAGANQ